MTGLFIGNSTGYGFAGVGCASLLVEISTIFINYRGFYAKNQMGDTIPQVI